MNTPMNLTDFLFEAKSTTALTGKHHEKQTVIKELMLKLVADNGIEKLVDTASVVGTKSGVEGVRIVHHDPKLSLVYKTHPPGYKSGAFDHGADCVTVTLKGKETSFFYAQDGNGTLLPVAKKDIGPGETLEIPGEAIRSVENPSQEEETCILICYLGDVQELISKRSVFAETQQETPYSGQEVAKRGNVLEKSLLAAI